MVDTNKQDTDFEAGLVSEDQHGWAQDAPGTGEAKDVIAEGKEPGRYDGPAQGESQRPTGTSTARDSTGVDPQEPIDDDSPGLQSGDQGG